MVILDNSRTLGAFENSLESSGHGDLVRGLPRGYSKGTIDGPNLLSYRYYIADNVRAI